MGIFFFSSYFSLLHGAHTSSAGADDTGVPVVSQIRISSPHAPHHHSVVLSLTGQTALVNKTTTGVVALRALSE